MTKGVDLQPRLARARLPRPVNPIPVLRAPYQVVGYELAAIHEGVPLTRLVSALNRAGLTVSNVKGHGLVIHQIGQHPEKPAIGPLGVS